VRISNPRAQNRPDVLRTEHVITTLKELRKQSNPINQQLVPCSFTRGAPAADDPTTLERPRPVHRSLHLTLLCCLLLSLVQGIAPGRVAAAPLSGSYAGWAMDAYPNMSQNDMGTALNRMRGAGSNLLWIGHPNPVEVNPGAREVGLSYAIYTALANPADPLNPSARSILAAQLRALDAARLSGLKVVLPVGYRSQMGAAWNAAHPSSLRRGADGVLIDFGGIDASPYAGDFRDDMARYYAWVEQNLIVPYRDVIVMINLADEPSGVDYSAPADSAFNAKYGFHFKDVGNNQTRITQLGQFQSHVMVDFAAWAGQQWMRLDPAVAVTMSFCGGIGRTSQQAPPLEDVFREVPPNFQPTWDAYLRDGTAADSLNDSDVTGLILLSGTLAHLSARYQRPYWLWSDANSWGLGQESGDPSNIADAMVNLRLLADISRQGGGILKGIAVWNYNLRGQGLYDGNRRTTYDPDQMFTRVTGTFPQIRQILDGPAGPGADVIVLAPNVMPYRLIGQSRLVDVFAFRGYNFLDLVSLARSGANITVSDTLAQEDMARTRMLVILARDASDLTPSDVARTQAFRATGGTVVDSRPVEDAYHFGAQWTAAGNAPETFFADQYTSRQVGPVGALGLPKLVNSFTIVGPREFVVYGASSSDTSDKMKGWINAPFQVQGVNYGVSGDRRNGDVFGPGLVAVSTQRHTFTLLPLVPASAPDNSTAVAHDGRYFTQTGFRIDNDAVWDYFNHRGGIRTFGYPTSRTFQFLGFQTQFFQRTVVQLAEDGSPRTLNLLDAGLLPYTSFNNSTFPASSALMLTTAPTPGSLGYSQRAINWIRDYAPDDWQSTEVNFGSTFNRTVTLTDAFPFGTGNVSLVPLLNLELWGLPTSQPMYDPNNHNFIYQRFQRGIMHYDAGCGCTQGILLADYLKALLLNGDVPADLLSEAADSPYLGQYDPSSPGWVSRPQQLPATDLTRAFERG